MPHDRKSRKIGVFMRRNARIGEKNRSTLDVLFKKTLTFDITDNNDQIWRYLTMTLQAAMIGYW